MNRWDDQGDYYTPEHAPAPLEVSPPCELLPEAEAHCEPRMPNCWKRYGA